MPRRPRLTMGGTPMHIIQRGNNRNPCFFSKYDYHFYLQTLYEQARRSECLIHAYVLMEDHIHLLITPRKENSAGMMMKFLGQNYTQYINRTYRRTGTLWEGR